MTKRARHNSTPKPKKAASRDPVLGERAMIAGIMEGSPEAVGVAVVRLDCGCRKMAAVDAHGEPASKVIMYRDQAESICPKCRQDNGDFSRVTRQFIHWEDDSLTREKKAEITAKVLGVTVDLPPLGD